MMIVFLSIIMSSYLQVGILLILTLPMMTWIVFQYCEKVHTYRRHTLSRPLNGQQTVSLVDSSIYQTDPGNSADASARGYGASPTGGICNGGLPLCSQACCCWRG